ncbi:NO-inducible flavohemoprotein [Neptunomonas sp.]
MLTQQHIDTVKETIPLLASADVAITDHFYRRMFSHNPELLDIFNASHQHSGAQKAALFEAIAGYAHHIDNVGALTAVIERIAQKHTSFNIQAHHYPIVGHHLIETLRELAGNAFTPDVEEAWSAAYGVLADVFIAREKAIYAEHSQQKGGWTGERRFIISQKVPESRWVTSFYLTPEDNKPVQTYQPGQYIGIRIKPDDNAVTEIRQYSLSDAPNGTTYRISVRREKREGNTIPGIASNYLHDHCEIGDIVELYAPAGDFFYSEKNAPTVLISAGVGLTPFQAMLESFAAHESTQTITYLHACNSKAEHSFKQRVDTLASCLDLKQHTWYLEGEAKDHVSIGQMNLIQTTIDLPIKDGYFYLCGPVGFMQEINQQLLELGVTKERIIYEVFGPHQSL